MKPKLFNVKFFIPFTLFIILVGLLAYSLTKNPRLLPSVKIGKSVPAFTLPSLYQHKTITAQTFKGHVTLLNVFATWCITCRYEHAVLRALKKYQHIRIVGLDYKDNPIDAMRWLKRLGNPYESVIVDRKGDLAIDLGVYGTPETFLIGPDGRIRYKYVGAITPTVYRDEFLPRIARAQAQD